MMLVSDPYKIVPFVFNCYPDKFKKFEEFLSETRKPGYMCVPDVTVLPIGVEESYEFSHVPTIFIDTEPSIHNAHIEYCQKLNAKPIHIVGVSCKSPTWHYKIKTFQYWSNLAFTSMLNQRLPPVEAGAKPYVANVLFGGWMPSRSIILKHLVDNQLLKSCLVNYNQRQTLSLEQNKQQLTQHPDLYMNYTSPGLRELDVPEFNELAYNKDGSIFTMVQLRQSHPGWLSQLIPWKLFNSTYLSVVGETENMAIPDTFLPSEKIAKPLFIGQPFVVYGAKDFLKNLREIGFRTYGQWIDESYDDVTDSSKRALKVAESVVKFARLSETDKLSIMHEAKEVCDYNRNIMLDFKLLGKPVVDAILNFKPT